MRYQCLWQHECVIGPGAQKKKCPAHESWDRADKWVSTEFAKIGKRETLQPNLARLAEQGLYDRSRQNLAQGADCTDLTRYTTMEKMIRRKGPGDPEQQRDNRHGGAHHSDEVGALRDDELGVIGPSAQKNWIQRRRDHVQELQDWVTDEF
ncbi:uncharacterized protein UBRO_20978 [Ustilago bromivora]|uniref:Uncharacterized protein n=1 Tax=Ustilago bromivora TaxID=307758 RepID=A0A1K0HGF3_9BASI|nr:uncharacterized protein UBRO_20978 [Ustilago bromivora]